jgi:biotin/methionine sulfoxide reductase
MELIGTHFGTYEVVRDAQDRPTLHGFRLDPRPSPVGQAVLDLADHPARVLRPMARKGWLEKRGGAGRGRDEFVALDWDHAATLVASEIERVRSTHTNEAIFGGSYGWASAGRFHHAQSQLKRFLNLCGGFVSSVNTYSYGAAAVLLPHVIGAAFKEATATSPTYDQILQHAGLVISFGGFRQSNAQVEAGGTGSHRALNWLEKIVAKGVRVIAVSPVGTDIPDIAGRERIEFVQIRPNTDAALMLAMAGTILAEGLADHAFLSRATVGFEPFAAYLRGETDGTPKTAAWAAAICGVPADTIRALAHAYRSTPALINVTWSLQRARFGEQPYFAAIALAAMAGHVGRPGCGFAFGLTAVNSVGQPLRRLRGAGLDQGRNPVGRFIPVARITELLTRPGEVLDYDGQKITLPDIRLVYWAGGNPFHHHQDLNLLAEAFRRPETVVVHESMWTATARHADIVLPASLSFERNDIAASSRDNWLVASRRILPPPAEVLDDHSIFAMIARELGAGAAFTEGLDEAQWLRRLYEGYRAQQPELPGFDAFWAAGYAGLDLDKAVARSATPLEAFAADPAGNPLETPSGKIEITSEIIAGSGYSDFPGHPAWMEPEEWLGAPLSARYPLHLLSPQPAQRLHSQLEHAGPAQAAKANGLEVVLLNTEDGKARDIDDGDTVELFNDRGRVLAAARLSCAVRQGVAVLPTGGWYQPVATPDGGILDIGGNPNSLTSHRPTSTLAQAPAPNSCLIEVRKANIAG